ncbi:MAG TPA: hypothetical protein VMZ53_26985 [Kofleriaceae bacterium]|nr:hypothetical protein [Kofleriaceae bacterium]
MTLAVLGVGAAGAAGVWLKRWFRPEQRTRRLLRRTRVTPIKELTDGQLACVVGTIVREGELIESLIERKRCVAFDTETNVFDGTGFSSPVRFETTRRMVPFYVVDATGRVRVDAPQVALSNKPIAKGQSFVERVLVEGQRVRLVGSVVLDPTMAGNAEHHFRETGGVHATLTGTAKFPLLADED